MLKKVSKNEERVRRHKRVRTKISGTAQRPRLCVFRSNANITVQVIDDVKGVTLVSASSVEMKLANGGNVEAAKAVGAEVAARALKANISSVVFDRGGYLYHGRVKALADSAREAGLNSRRAKLWNANQEE
jgi:large subunit ribosomal protein L18